MGVVVMPKTIKKPNSASPLSKEPTQLHLCPRSHNRLNPANQTSGLCPRRNPGCRASVAPPAIGGARRADCIRPSPRTAEPSTHGNDNVARQRHPAREKSTTNGNDGRRWKQCAAGATSGRAAADRPAIGSPAARRAERRFGGHAHTAPFARASKQARLLARMRHARPSVKIRRPSADSPPRSHPAPAPPAVASAWPTAWARVTAGRSARRRSR